MARLALTLEPGVGILPIRLGATQAEIRVALAAHGIELETSRDGLDYFFESAIQVEYELDGTASFIGIASHADIELSYLGRSILQLPAREVFGLIAEEEGGEHTFAPREYLFRKQIITLWQAAEDYDRSDQGREVWGQIGLGDTRYLAAINQYR